MNYQWYPGHMTKAVRMMKDELNLVDLLIELVDARIPLSSRNPDIDELGKNKFRLVILNKADLADSRVTELWQSYFANKGIKAITLDARNTGAVKKTEKAVREICKEKLERDAKRGIKNRPIRAMVCGIPNVGKSTFINSFVGRQTAKTGNKPGVTKSKQWIRLSDTLELLDTPGILWPKFEDQSVGMKLAVIGSINDDIIAETELAYDMISILDVLYPGKVADKYEVEQSEDINRLIENIAIARGAVKAGGEADIKRSSGLLIDEFRAGKIGRFSLEIPDAGCEN